MAGVAQRTVYRLRRDVEAKLERLPLQYFDQHPHGDIIVASHQRHRQHHHHPAAGHVASS